MKMCQQVLSVMAAQLHRAIVWLACVLSIVISTSVSAAETITYYHHDALGSSVAATNEYGDVLWREAYRPFGERIRHEDGGTNSVWYTGKQHEDEIGLTYFGARWYDPVVWRFMAVDPAEIDPQDRGLFNRYSYAKNSPYGYVDPDGRVPLLIPVVLIVGKELAGVAFEEATGLPAVFSVKGAATAAGKGVAKAAGRAAREGGQQAGSDVRQRLPDNALVCRGGSCTADKFENGSGVILDAQGNLNGVSVNSAAGKSLDELTVGIPHKKVGVTTVGDVRKAGGDVIPSPNRNNPNHATLQGITPRQAQDLMTPTVKNPNAR